MDSNNNLKHKFSYAVKWITIGNLSSQIIRWLVTFWVIRILAPEDYGIIAIAGILEGLLIVLTQQGLISPLIQKKNINNSEYEEYFGTIIIIHVLFFVGQYFSAELIANLYNEPILADVIKLASFSFLILIFNAIPSAEFTKKLKFKELSIIAFIANTSAALLTLYLAFNDFGLWSIVYGQIFNLMISTLLKAMLYQKFIRPRFGIKKTRDLFTFGILMSINSILAYAILSLDVLLGGLKLSVTELGIYAVALQISLIPLKKIGPIIKQVTFPLIAGIQDNKAKVSDISARLQKIAMLLIFPIFWGISATADLFIPLIIGVKWSAAIIPIQIITLVIPLRFSTEIYSACVKGLGKGKSMISNSLITISIMTPAISIGMFYGPTGLASAWLIGYSLTYLILISRYKKLLQLHTANILTPLTLPIILCTLMYGEIEIIKYLMLGSSSIVVLITSVVAAITFYMSFLFIFDKKSILEIKSLKKKKQ
jgi:O-antigen/teichoic acid export membrane protein